MSEEVLICADCGKPYYCFYLAKARCLMCWCANFRRATKKEIMAMGGY